MSAPRLTIGMATYDDFHGTYFTLEALGIYHRPMIQDCEIIVVDNHPGSSHSRDLVAYLGAISGKWNREARYIPMRGTPSTSQPRNRIFDEAASSAVLVMDCHVLLHPLALVRTVEFFECNTGDGLYNGPMVYDWLDSHETGWADEWRGGMWGTWHRDARGDSEDAPPFDVFACGLGCFAARKDAWQAVGGFPREYRSFGGEECVIHEMFRQANRPVQCLPWLKWTHRFGNPDGARYPKPMVDIIRNYMIGLQRIGLPFDRLRKHFVDERRISAEVFDAIAADPINYKAAPKSSKVDGAFVHGAKEGSSLETLFQEVSQTKRDLDEVALPIRNIAIQCERVVALVKRGEWEPILAAARPVELRVWQTEESKWTKLTHDAVELEMADDGKLAEYATTTGPGADSLAAVIPPCDLLVIDTVHTADRLYQELMKHATMVSRWILVRGSRYHWDKDEGGDGPGMGDGFARFRAMYPEWHRTQINTVQYGFTLLSRDPADVDLDSGPGTEFGALVAQLGFESGPQCSCKALMARMNAIGVEGCRREREPIVAAIRDNAKAWGWGSFAVAAAKAVVTGLVIHIDPTDPIGSLVDLAIARAEAKLGGQRKAVAA